MAQADSRSLASTRPAVRSPPAQCRVPNVGNAMQGLEKKARTERHEAHKLELDRKRLSSAPCCRRASHANMRSVMKRADRNMISDVVDALHAPQRRPTVVPAIRRPFRQETSGRAQLPQLRHSVGDDMDPSAGPSH